MQFVLLLKARRLHFRTWHQGLPISIEHRRGSIRRGVDPEGKPWAVKMHVHYGYVRGSLATDLQHFDCFLGGCHDAPYVYVVNQMEPPDFQRVGEQKAMLGFMSQRQARTAFLAHYPDARFLGRVTRIPIERFRQKLATTREQPRLLRG